MKIELVFVGDLVYVPPPLTWIEGVARKSWLTKHYGDKSRMTSLSYWEELKSQYGSKFISEKNGVLQYG